MPFCFTNFHYFWGSFMILSFRTFWVMNWSDFYRLFSIFSFGKDGYVVMRRCEYGGCSRIYLSSYINFCQFTKIREFWSCPHRTLYRPDWPTPDAFDQLLSLIGSIRNSKFMNSTSGFEGTCITQFFFPLPPDTHHYVMQNGFCIS